jgi:hypothetical protein
MRAVAIKKSSGEKTIGFQEMGTLRCDGCGEEFLIGLDSASFRSEHRTTLDFCDASQESLQQFQVAFGNFSELNSKSKTRGTIGNFSTSQ